MWLTLLQQAVDAENITQVAARLKVSRTTISLVLADKYPASKDRIAARVLDVYGRIRCPFMDREIVQAECRDYRTRAVPTSSPRAMQHWRACQGCETGKNLNKEASCKPQ